MRLCIRVATLSFLTLAAASSPGQPLPPGGAPAIDPHRAVAAGPKGSLAIRGVQGTKDGPEVGADEVEVVLFHQNQPFHQMKAALDEHGIVVVRELPVAMAARPVVRIKHAGVLYQEVGPTMGADRPDAAMEVTVYETTDEAPPWKVTMRHLAAERATIGLLVSEMLVVDNPADRTWLGGAPDSQNRRATVSVTLPKDAADIQLGAGFHGWCCTTFIDGTLNIQMPLMPGRMTYKFAYRVAEPGGRADLRIAAPVQSEQIVFMLPPEGSSTDAVLVEAVSSPEAAASGGRLFKAAGVSPGAQAGLVLVTAAAPVVAMPAPAQAGGFAAHTKIIAGVVCGVVLLVGLLMAVKRKSGARA